MNIDRICNRFAKNGAPIFSILLASYSPSPAMAQSNSYLDSLSGIAASDPVPFSELITINQTVSDTYISIDATCSRPYKSNHPGVVLIEDKLLSFDSASGRGHYKQHWAYTFDGAVMLGSMKGNDLDPDINPTQSVTKHGNFPTENGSSATITSQSSAYTITSQGTTRAPPAAISNLGEIVTLALGDKGAKIYWSNFLKWPVAKANGDGSFYYTVVGFTIDGKSYGLSCDEAKSKVENSDLAAAGKERSAQLNAQMWSQALTGLTTLGEQASLNAGRAQKGLPAVTLLVPNFNAPDGGQGAIDLNNQIIATASAGSSAQVHSISSQDARRPAGTAVSGTASARPQGNQPAPTVSEGTGGIY